MELDGYNACMTEYPFVLDTPDTYYLLLEDQERQVWSATGYCKNGGQWTGDNLYENTNYEHMVTFLIGIYPNLICE